MGIHVLCPFHPDTRPSLYIDEERNCHCFGCGWRGQIVEVMRHWGYTGVSLLTQQQEFLESHGYRPNGRRGTHLMRPTDGWSRAPLSGDPSDPAVRREWGYLLDRGYWLPTLDRFGTRSWRGLIFGWEGQGGWVTRWWDGTYLYDPGMTRQSLYVYDESILGRDAIVVVEGILDAMRVYQAGIDAVAATLGGPTSGQIQQLRGFRRIYEMFDCDDGGDAHRRALERAGVHTIRVRYPGGDPGDLTEAQVVQALAQTLSGGGLQ